MGNKTFLAAIAVVLCAANQTESHAASHHRTAGHRGAKLHKIRGRHAKIHSTIESVQAHQTSTGVEVLITGKNLARPTELAEPNSTEYRLWFRSLLRRPLDLPVGQSGLESVKSGRRSKWSTFLVLKLSDTAKPQLEATPEGWKVTVSSAAATTTNLVTPPQIPSPRGRGQGEGSPAVSQANPQTTSTQANAQGQGSPTIPQIPSPQAKAQVQGSPTTPQTPSPRGRGQGEGSPLYAQANPQTPSPQAKAQVQGSATTPQNPSPQANAQGQGSTTIPQTPSPRGRGQGEGSPAVSQANPQTPPPQAKAQGQGSPVSGSKPPAQARVKPSNATPQPYPKNIATIVDPSRQLTRSDHVSLEFANTDIVQILRALALQTGVNIVTSPEVKGNLSVSLNDVSVDEALRMVTGLSEFGFTHVDGTVIVAPLAKLEPIRRQISGEGIPKPEEPTTDAYLVKGGMAEDLVTAIAGKSGNSVGHTLLLATPPGSASRQAIVLRGPEAEVKVVHRTLEELDDADETVGTFEVYEVQHLDPRALREELIGTFPGLRASVLPASVGNPSVYVPGEIAKEVSAIMKLDTKAGGSDTVNYVDKAAATAAQQNSTGAASGAGAAPSGGGSSSGSSDGSESVMGFEHPFSSTEKTAVPMKLVLRGSRQQIDNALAYLKKIDVAPKQVALELRVMELSREDALRVGLDWSVMSGGGTVKTVRINQSLGDTADTPGVLSAGLTGPISVTATLDKMANNRNLIARPNLLALDGRSAELFVGDVIRYIKTIQSSQNGTTVETGEERVGVRLAVLPRIGADGQIVLDMQPVVSYLTGYTPVPGGGQLPQTSERGEQTTATVKSGETIALGGLIQVQDTDQVNGIPILKDLPIVGQLFRRRNKDRVKTEIVFFLTAKVVDDNNRSTAANPNTNNLPTGAKG